MVCASAEAVALCRELADRNRGAYLPRLAMVLNNHASGLHQADRTAEAIPVSLEAVDVRRELVARNCEAHLPDLAMSLTNHSVYLAWSGESAQALPMVTEAIDIRRDTPAVAAAVPGCVRRRSSAAIMPRSTTAISSGYSG